MNSPDSIQTRLGWVLSYFKGERTEAAVHHRSGSPSSEEVLHKGCISLHWLVHLTIQAGCSGNFSYSPLPPICCLFSSLVTRAHYVGEVTA